MIPFFLFAQDFTHLDLIVVEISQTTSSKEKEIKYRNLIKKINSHSEKDAIEEFRYFLKKDRSTHAHRVINEELTPLLIKSGQVEEAAQRYADIAWRYIEQYSDSALLYADRSFQISKENNYPFGEVVALETKGVYYEWVENDYEKASQYFFQAIAVCETADPTYMGSLYHALGVMFYTTSDFVKSEHYFKIAFQLAKKYNDANLQKISLRSMGTIFLEKDELDTAQKFFEESLEIESNPEYDYETFANLGQIYNEKQKLKEAISYFEKSVEQTPDNKRYYVNLPYLLDAKKKNNDLNDIQFILNHMHLAVNKNIPDVEKSNLLYALSKHYEEIKDFPKALRYKNDYLSLYETIKEKQRDEIVYEMEAKYQNQKNKEQIEKEASKRKQLLTGFILAVLFLVSILFFYWKKLSYQKTIAKKEEEINHQKIKQLSQENKLVAMNSMMEGQENERMRIAQDLHDGLGGLLGTIKTIFSTIPKENSTDKEKQIFHKTDYLIDEACLEVRRISHNMMPQSLQISGLENALTDLGASLNEEKINTNIEIEKIPFSISDNYKITIYRIVQEIIHNIRKHSEAKNVLIQLFTFEKLINIIIEDDGKGFDQNNIDLKGIGLKNIQNRIDYLNGKIEYDSIPGRGTTITIEIPVT